MVELKHLIDFDDPGFHPLRRLVQLARSGLALNSEFHGVPSQFVSSRPFDFTGLAGAMKCYAGMISWDKKTVIQRMTVNDGFQFLFV